MNIFTILLVLSYFFVDRKFINNAYLNSFRNVIIVFAAIMLLKYVLYMIIAPWYEVLNYLENKKYSRHTKLPIVSVIIPAWNEDVGIISTFKSVLKSSYPKIEIIIINDGSTDDSHGSILKFMHKYKQTERRTRSVKYIYKKNGGKGKALNTGITRARGEIIITIDADCLLDKHAIRNFVSHFDNPKIMAAVGNVKIANSHNFIENLQYLEFLFSFYFKKTDSILNSIYIIGGAAGAFRKSVFEKIGEYSTSNITEDIELSMRIQQNGMRIKYAADSIVYTEGASSLEGLMKQRLRWKKGRIETFIEYSSLFFSRNKSHNKILTFIMLPMAIFGDLQLSLELLFLFFLFIYTSVTYDSSVLISGMIVVWTMFLVQIIFDDKKQRNLKNYMLILSAWLMFYVTTIVEVYALIKASTQHIRKKEVVWQSWERKGIEIK